MRQQQRRAASTAALLIEARAAFARNGYANTSLDSIVAAAGYSKGALYNNFRTKQDLFLAVVREVLNDGETRVTRVCDALAAGVSPVAAARRYYDHDPSQHHAQLLAEAWRVAATDEAVRELLEWFRSRRLASIESALVDTGMRLEQAREQAALVVRLIDADTVERVLEFAARGA